MRFSSSVSKPGAKKRFDVMGEVSKQEIATDHEGCRLCWAMSASGRRHPVNSVLFETDRYAVVPALGALVSGYVMLVSKDHCASAATIEAAELAVLEALLTEVLAMLRQKFAGSSWLVFEHGTALQCGTKACCVDHLHLHLVPLQMDLAGELERRLQHVPQRIKSLVDLKNVNFEITGNYIYVRNPDDSCYAFAPEAYSSQLVRQVIAGKVGQEQRWNWMNHPLEQSTVQTLREFRDAGVSPRTIYFAHAIEGIDKAALPATIADARAALAQRVPGVQMLSMHELLEGILDGTELNDDEINHFLVETERRFVESCDLVLVDLSLSGWQYVGSLMEIVYARLAGVPVVAIVGESNIGMRRWLRAHIDECVRNLDEAMSACGRILQDRERAATQEPAFTQAQ